METKIRARGRVSGVAMDIKANQAGDLLFGPGGADYEDITRGGHAFHCIANVGVATDTVYPTLATAFMCWNSAPDGGRSMIVDAVFAICDVGSGILAQYGMIYVLGQTRVATVADTIAVRRNNGLGITTDSVAICAEGGNLDAITGVDLGWMPIGNTLNQAVISLTGMVLWEEVNGRIIIPPGRAFGLHTMGADVDSDFVMGMMWHEKTIKLA